MIIFNAGWPRLENSWRRKSISSIPISHRCYLYLWKINLSVSLVLPSLFLPLLFSLYLAPSVTLLSNPISPSLVIPPFPTLSLSFPSPSLSHSPCILCPTSPPSRFLPLSFTLPYSPLLTPSLTPPSLSLPLPFPPSPSLAPCIPCPTSPPLAFSLSLSPVFLYPLPLPCCPLPYLLPYPPPSLSLPLPPSCFPSLSVTFPLAPSHSLYDELAQTKYYYQALSLGWIRTKAESWAVFDFTYQGLGGSQS